MAFLTSRQSDGKYLLYPETDIEEYCFLEDMKRNSSHDATKSNSEERACEILYKNGRPSEERKTRVIRLLPVGNVLDVMNTYIEIMRHGGRSLDDDILYYIEYTLPEGEEPLVYKLLAKKIPFGHDNFAPTQPGSNLIH
jgi:hypothetical protein